MTAPSSLLLRGLARAGLWLSLSAACGLLPVAPALAAGDSKVEPTEVRGWLMRIHDAASTRNFQGTFIVSSANSMASARIAHYCEGHNQYERIESLDGQTRNVFRHNDVVQTMWPQGKVALVEHRGLLTTFPSLLQAGDDHIAELYEMRAQGNDRVAGHEASILLLKPRDGHRFGYRLWADKASGLLLRAETLGERGEVLETSAFSDVQIGVRSQPDSVLQPMKKLDGYRLVKPSLVPASLEAEGWEMLPAVSGFRQVSCVKRMLDSSSAPPDSAAPGPGAPVLQTIYSDGLTYVSVFIEKYDAARHPKPMSTAIGATQTLMRRQGDAWITLIGDVPAATLKAFADALQHRK